MAGELAALEAKVEKVLPGGRVAGYAATHSPPSSPRTAARRSSSPTRRPDPNQSFGNNPEAAKQATAAFKGVTIAGAPVHVTGYDALSVQSGGGTGPGVLVEALLGGFGALLVLAFVFGSFLAVVPLLMAVVSILTTFLVVWGLTTVTEVSPIVQFLVALIGLGVSIDYSLLVVVRWREERAHGLSGDAAIERAMETAGRAVVFSGTTVAIGLLALVALPLPFLRSVGYGGLLIPLISVIVAMTLLPVVLAQVRLPPGLASRSRRRQGERLLDELGRDDRPPPLDRRGSVRPSSWPRWCSPPPTSSWASRTSTRWPRRATPSRACWRSRTPASVRARWCRTRPSSKVRRQPEAVATALWRACPASTAPSPPPGAVADPHRRRSSMRSGSTTDPPRRDEKPSIASATATLASGPDVHLGGLPAENQDFIDAVYGNFPLMIALIGVVTFVLLARAFRSLLLPLKAVILNVISVAAAWGVLSIVWQHGHGSELDLGHLRDRRRSRPGSR